MSDYLDSLQRRLVDASARLSAERRRRRRRRLAGLGVLVLVVGAPAVAATGVWRPPIGNGQADPPRITAQAPPAAQLELLGVLRRRQTEADRSGPTLEALKFVGRGVDGVRTDSVRLLAAGGPDKGVVLIPVERYQLSMPRPPADSPPEMKARFAPKRDGLCLMALDRVDGGGASCFSTQDVRDGRAWQSLGRRGTFIVPDGVARVRVEFVRGRTVETDVRDNLAIYSSTRGGTVGWTRVTWFDERGAVVRELREARPTAEDPYPHPDDPVAPGSTRGGAVLRVTVRGSSLTARYGVVTRLRSRNARQPVFVRVRLTRPACAGKRTVVDKNIGGIVTRRRVYDQTLIVSPSSGDFHRARWCAGDYSGAVVAGKRTIGTFSFRVTE